MKPHTKKWRAVPSTLHTSNPASVRMDIVDDGAEFSPAFVAGDILPEDARLMAASHDLLTALEEAKAWFNLEDHKKTAVKVKDCEVGTRMLQMIEAALTKAKGQP